MADSKDKSLDERFRSLPAQFQAAVVARPHFPTRREKRLAVALFGTDNSNLDAAKEILAEHDSPTIFASQTRSRALRKLAGARGYLYSVEWTDGTNLTSGDDFLTEEEARAFFNCFVEDVLNPDYARAMLAEVNAASGVYMHIRLTSRLVDAAGTALPASERLLDTRYAAMCSGCGKLLAAEGVAGGHDGLLCSTCSSCACASKSGPERLQCLLDNKFGGVLRESSNPEDSGQADAMELLSVSRGVPWTSSPDQVHCFDLSPLYKIQVSPETRTKHFLPVLAAYDGSLDWPIQRKQRVAERLAILTVQRLVSELPGVPEACRNACREAHTLAEAAAAATKASAEAHSGPGADAQESPASALWAAKAAQAASVALAKTAAETAASAAYVALAQRAMQESAKSVKSAVLAAAEAARTAASAEVKAAKGAGTPGQTSLGARERIFRMACAAWVEAVE
jgi:hypothetical protein